MLRIFSSFVAVASALHIGEEKKSQHHVAAVQQKTVLSNKVQRTTMNLANSLAHLGGSVTKKQEPGAEGEAPPAHPIDEDGYSADWGTEHRSDAYPAESVGKQHHPKYNTIAKKQYDQVWWKWFFGSWWFWIVIAVVVLIIAAFVMKAAKK